MPWDAVLLGGWLIATELKATARGLEHRAVTFEGPGGEALVSYGQACAIDPQRCKLGSAVKYA